MLPTGAAAIVGFWLLAAGTALGWFAAMLGAVDLVALWQKHDRSLMSNGLIHGAVNGSALLGFTVLLALEYGTFPAIAHGAGFLSGEVALLIAMFTGNYFGGAVIWSRVERSPTAGR